jgi:phenylpropionate dioxygenase-like ring-hydroxylating dioxygenase large terminal subunit
VLPGEQGFPFITTLTGAAAKGTHYVQIYPNLNFAATKDCVFYLEIHPLGVDRTRLVLGSLFPEETVARPDFDAVVERYYRRLDKSAPEDFQIAEIQQKGLSSPLARPGRLSTKEPLVHHIANWVLDRVVGGDEPAAAAS